MSWYLSGRAQDGQEVLMGPETLLLGRIRKPGTGWAVTAAKRVGGTGEESLTRHLWLGAFLCKHSIISCTSKSRAKLPRKFYFHKNWSPLQGAKPDSQRKSHLPRQWLWWFHTKLVTKAGKSHQNASEIHAEFHQAHPAFCPLSGDSGHFQGIHHLLITPFQASALTTIFMVQPMSSCPQHQGGNLEVAWISTASPRGSSSLPSHECFRQQSLPALRMSRSVLCSPRDRADVLQEPLHQAPGEGFTFLHAGCWTFPHPLTVCPELHSEPSTQSPLNNPCPSRQLPASSQGCTDSGLLHLSVLSRWPEIH